MAVYTAELRPALINTNVYTATLDGFIETHASSSGTVKLQWAQISATGTLTLYDGSFITFEKIS
jgi:hypothetical protein